MKYKCLVLDHDDTVVRSTEEIHYPSFIEYLKIYRPSFADAYPLPLFLEKNFDIGLMEIFRRELSMTEEEISEEGRFWERYVNERIPTVFDGIGEILRKFSDMGGIIAVSSHSKRSFILRDYLHWGLPEPKVIYAWDDAPEKRKPSPAVIRDVCERYGILPKDILVVDDAKIGCEMARAAGADFAAARWSYKVERFEEELRSVSDFYLDSVSELNRVIF